MGEQATHLGRNGGDVLSERVLSQETVHQAIQRLGLGWKRAKQWITSPDPAYERTNARARRLSLAEAQPDWVVGFVDETWWSRLAHPALHTLDPGRGSGFRCV